jgi:hypothetical protein
MTLKWILEKQFLKLQTVIGGGGGGIGGGVAYESVPKSFRTGRLERELQMVQLCATRCSCIAILWVSLVSFAVITLRVASQRCLLLLLLLFILLSTQSGKFGYTLVLQFPMTMFSEHGNDLQFLYQVNSYQTDSLSAALIRKFTVETVSS